METTEIINGKEVVFEAVGIADKHDYGVDVQLDGHTKTGDSWIKTHEATGYVLGGKIQEVSDIEEV